MDSVFCRVLFAAVAAGAGCGLMGVYVVGLRIPFVGICISHAAMAGAVLAVLIGYGGSWPAVLCSGLAALTLTAVRPHRSRLDPNVAMAVLFSLTLGLTFLGIGLIQSSRSDVLGLLWGNILFVDQRSVTCIWAASGALALFACAFNKELKALLFSRSLALATGLHEGLVYGLFLALCGVTLSVDLPLVGGLMIFSLITNPAAAAYQVCTGHRSVVATSVAFGVLSALVGVVTSYALDLPTGACIVIASALIFGTCALIHTLRGTVER